MHKLVRFKRNTASFSCCIYDSCTLCVFAPWQIGPAMPPTCVLKYNVRVWNESNYVHLKNLCIERFRFIECSHINNHISRIIVWIPFVRMYMHVLADYYHIVMRILESNIIRDQRHQKSKCEYSNNFEQITIENSGTDVPFIYFVMYTQFYSWKVNNERNRKD